LEDNLGIVFAHRIQSGTGVEDALLGSLARESKGVDSGE
jgi:hypothetical protein